MAPIPILSRVGSDFGFGKRTATAGATALSFSASLLSTLSAESGGSQAQAEPSIAQTSDGSVILASGNRNSVYRSTNGGQTWTLTYDGTETSFNYGHGGGIYINDSGTHAIASPNGSNFGKIIYSSNGGQSWTTKVTTNDSNYVGVYDQTTGIVMMGDRGAGGGGTSQINRSSDHGVNWTVPLSSNESDHNMVSMKKGSAGNAVGWSVSKYYTSTDGGANWTQQATPSGHIFTGARYTIFDSTGKYYYPRGGTKTILSATTLTGARTSTSISSTGNVTCLQIDSSDIIYVGTNVGEIFYSTDYGVSYQALTAWNTYHTAGKSISDISTQSSSGRFLVGTAEGSSGNKIHVLQKTGG